MNKPFYALDKGELAKLLQEWGEPGFRLEQVLEQAYALRRHGFSEAHNLPKALRARLEESHPLRTGRIASKAVSRDGETVKFLLRLADGESVETVIIGAPSRRSVCISSQVGCDLGCRFCASTIGGKRRDLGMHEILEQFAAAQSISEERITHVVLMGMGEPLLNYANVVKALRVLTGRFGFGLSHRRVTLSTIGVVEGMRMLANESLRVNLAVSLHAPNQELRKHIVPSAERWKFEDILAAAAHYQERTGRQVTMEYCLIDGFNDSAGHARMLGKRLKGTGFAVNLIPYNPVAGLEWKRPRRDRVRRFRDVLTALGVPATVRREKGADISAACGQLRRRIDG